MRKLLEIILLVAAFSLVAGNGWALSVNVGDVVTMTAPPGGEKYFMDDKTTGATFNTFCLEIENYFSPGNDYIVESVGMVTFGGGVNDGTVVDGGDPVSKEAIWLYASYFDSVFDYSPGLVDKVQNAIWYAEDEITNSDDFDDLIAYAFNGTSYDFSVTGWDIQAVNLVSSDQFGGTFGDNQSQLVGAPVPEPATMLLFGTGLIGLAGIARRRSNKK